MKQKISKLVSEKSTFSRTTPSRLWFMSKGYKHIDPTLVFGRIFYIRVEGQEVSILNADGCDAGIYLSPNKKSVENHRKTNQYYYLKFKANYRTRHVPISLLVMATYNHKVPDRSKGEVIDHIDGNTLNNNPRNLRIVTRPINDRDAGFMRKMRNNGYPVDKHPTVVILKGYENMAKWKAVHTEWQYQCLRGNDLLRVFFGPMFTIVDPDIIMDLEPLKPILIMPNDIAKLRRLMRTANYLKKQNPVVLRGNAIGNSRALKYAWWFEDFRAKLRTGTYRFSYLKKDGSIREAVGTLNMDSIPAEHHPKSGIDPVALAPTNTFCYYDLYADGDTGGWRSFCLDLFIGFVEQVA